MAVKNTTQVLIGGKIVTLSGYESEEYLQKVANYMNNKLTELGQIPGYNRQTLETRHTLLSLNIADDYFKAKRQAEGFSTEHKIAGCHTQRGVVLLLMGKTAMDKKSYLRPVPRIDLDRELFPE